MKIIKNYWLIAATFLAILTVAIGFTVAWSSLANNAFADEQENTAGEVEEATTEEGNALAQFSFSFSGLAEGVVPEIEAKSSGVTFDYTPGTYLDIDEKAIPIWDYSNGKLMFAVSSASGYAYQFIFSDPFGYDCKSFPGGKKITGTTDFVIEYQGYEGTYTINALVTDGETNAVVPNCELTYCDKDYNIVAIASTGADGICKFEGIKREQAEGLVAISQDGYVSDTDNITYSDYDMTTHTAEANLTARSDAESKVKLRSSDEHHQAYEITLEVRLAADPSEIISSWYNKAYKLSANMEGYEGVWQMTSDGVLENKTQQDEVILSWTIKPIAADGYKLDYCAIDRGDGNKFNVSPGGTFTLNVGDKIWIESFYTDNSQPQPEPEPTPEPTPGENVNAVPQTGDSVNAIIPLAVLATACALAFFSRRKTNQN